MRTLGGKVVRGRWGRSATGRSRTKSLAADDVGVLVCCTAPGLVVVRHGSKPRMASPHHGARAAKHEPDAQCLPWRDGYLSFRLLGEQPSGCHADQVAAGRDSQLVAATDLAE